MATSTPSKPFSSSGENGNKETGNNENKSEIKKIKLKNMNSLLKEEFVNPETSYYQPDDDNIKGSSPTNPLAIENNDSSQAKLKDSNYYLDDDQSNDAVSFEFTKNSSTNFYLCHRNF